MIGRFASATVPVSTPLRIAYAAISGEDASEVAKAATASDGQRQWPELLAAAIACNSRALCVALGDGLRSNREASSTLASARVSCAARGL